MSLETKILLLDLPIATTVFLSWKNMEIQVYTDSHAFTYTNILYRITCIYMKLNMNLCWRFQCQCISTDQSIFFLCLPVTSHSYLSPGCCHHCLLYCSMPVCIRVVNLYPHEKQLGIQFFVCVLNSSAECLMPAPLPPPPLVRLFHTFVTQLDCFATFCFLSWDSWPPKWLLFPLLFVRPSVLPGARVMYPSHITRNSLTALKNPRVSTTQLLPLLSIPLGNHWSLHPHSNCAFCRKYCVKILMMGTSLVAQWLRVHLPMQGICHFVHALGPMWK